MAVATRQYFSLMRRFAISVSLVSWDGARGDADLSVLADAVVRPRSGAENVLTTARW
jgi:hypothetical protein